MGTLHQHRIAIPKEAAITASFAIEALFDGDADFVVLELWGLELVLGRVNDSNGIVRGRVSATLNDTSGG